MKDHIIGGILNWSRLLEGMLDHTIFKHCDRDHFCFLGKWILEHDKLACFFDFQSRPRHGFIRCFQHQRQILIAKWQICDGCHSTPAALNNYFMSKGPDYSIMISDALMAKGTPVGSKYIFGGNEIVIYPDGSAHLTSTGGLAGSTLNINKGLKILVEDAMVPFNYALNACTINPARCLHLDDRKGSIQVGKDADLVVLEDNYDVLQTYCKGQAKL